MSMSSQPRRSRAQDDPVRRRKSAGNSQPRRASHGAPNRRRPPQKGAPRSAGASAKARPPQNRRRRRKQRVDPIRTLIQWVVAIVAALAIALIFRTFLVDIVKTSGNSMSGTVAMNDTVVVTKFDYWVGSPSRGDVVCFELPSGGRTIKRVVGLPGETVEIVQGAVHIDGQPLSEGYVSSPDSSSFLPSTVPAGYFLVLSDNRPEGGDSRSAEVGLIARNQLAGRVRFVLWPLNHMGGVR